MNKHPGGYNLADGKGQRTALNGKIAMYSADELQDLSHIDPPRERAPKREPADISQFKFVEFVPNFLRSLNGPA
jgi:hypothetical protein